MLRLCPPHTPTGKKNPSVAIPPAYKLPRKHVSHTASYITVDLLKPPPPFGPGLPALHSYVIEQQCVKQSGRRKHATSNRGRPRTKNLVITPKVLTVFYVRFDGTVTGAASGNTLTIGFRTGKQYHWDGITSYQASQFFPGCNFNTSQLFTDEPDVHRALDYFNKTAKRTFLRRSPDRTNAGTPTYGLVWNPTGKVGTTTALVGMTGNWAWQFQVTATNGKPPTGLISFAADSPHFNHTLVAGDNGLWTFNCDDGTVLALPYEPTASFAGDTHFSASASTITGLTAYQVPYYTGGLINVTCAGPRANDWISDTTVLCVSGLTTFTVTGALGSYAITATSNNFFPPTHADRFGWFSLYCAYGPYWL